MSGYKQKVCLWCNNKYKAITSNPLQFSQESKCDIALSKVKSPKLKYEIKYNGSSTDSSRFGLNSQSLFNNLDSENCPITSCKLKTKGCS